VAGNAEDVAGNAEDVAGASRQKSPSLSDQGVTRT